MLGLGRCDAHPQRLRRRVFGRAARRTERRLGGLSCALCIVRPAPEEKPTFGMGGGLWGCGTLNILASQGGVAEVSRSPSGHEGGGMEGWLQHVQPPPWARNTGARCMSYMGVHTIVVVVPHVVSTHPLPIHDLMSGCGPPFGGAPRTLADMCPVERVDLSQCRRPVACGRGPQGAQCRTVFACRPGPGVRCPNLCLAPASSFDSPSGCIAHTLPSSLRPKPKAQGPLSQLRAPAERAGLPLITWGRWGRSAGEPRSR